MKQLFERFEEESRKAEEILEKGITLVRDRKNPGADLCDEIGSALKDLRSLYGEIAAKLPSGTENSLPEDPSVREMEQFWRDSVFSKHLALKKVLSEFVRVCSDEERYQEAIRPQIGEAEKLLAQMEADIKTEPDVSAYDLFLQGIKADPDSDEELYHRIEDELDDLFSSRALSGLMRKKYYIRPEKDVPEGMEDAIPVTKEEFEDIIREKNEQIIMPEATEETRAPDANTAAVAMAAVAAEMNVEEPEPEQDAKGLPGIVNTFSGPVEVMLEKDTPASEAHASKFVSKAKDHFSAMALSLVVLSVYNLIPVEKIPDDALPDGVLPEQDIKYLYNQGYLGVVAFNVKGTVQRYYVPSSKAFACLKKQAVLSFLKSATKDHRVIPGPSELVSPGEWSPAFAYRAKMMIDYFLASRRKTFFNITRSLGDGESVLGVREDDNGRDNYFISCLPEDDADSIALDTSKISINESPNQDTVILLEDDSQVPEKAAVFSDETKRAKKKLKFAVLSDVDHFYDLSGKVLEEPDPEAKEDEAVAEVSPEELEEEEKEYIHPRKPIPKAKDPSNARFDELLARMNKLFSYLHNNLTFRGLMDEAQVVKDMEKRDYTPAHTRDLIADLEDKGYLAVYEYEGRSILCFTELMWSCLNKASLRNLIKRRFDMEDVKPCRLYGKQDAPLKVFLYNLKMSDLFGQFFGRLRADDQLMAAFPRFGWDADAERFCFKRPFSSPETEEDAETTLMLYSMEEFVSRSVTPGEGLICYSQELPQLENITEDALYYCLTDEGLYFIDEDENWEALIQTANKADESEKPEEEVNAEGPSETEESEPATTVPEKLLEPGEPKAPAEPAEVKAEPEQESESKPEPKPEKQKPAPAKPKAKDAPAPQITVEEPVAEKTESAPIPADAEKHVAKAKEAFALGRFDIGNVILQGVSRMDENYALLAKQYSYATWDPANAEDYRPSNLMKSFPEQNGKDPENDLLFMASWLRMYFSEAASFESYLAREKKQLEGNLSNDYAPSLTDAVNMLADWTKNQGRGLDQALLESALKHSTMSDRATGIQKKFREMLDSGELLRSNHYTNRIKGTREALFGKASELYRQMQTVVQDDRNQAAKIKNEIAPYVAFENGVVSVNEDAIEDLMDDAWRGTASLAKGKGQADELTGVERNTLRNKLNTIYQLLGNWLLAAGTGKASSTAGNDDVVKLVERVKPLLTKAEQELMSLEKDNADIAAPLSVLAGTLRGLLHKFEQNSDEDSFRKYYYIHLLKEPLVALDEDFLPYIEGPDEQINPYDFCERAEQYLSAGETTWEAVIKRIFSPENPRNGADFGVARLLKEYLNDLHPEVHWPQEYDIDRAVDRALDKNSKRSDSVLLWEKDFAARVEMADGDGWFATTEDRSRLERARNAVHDVYFLSENFGFYGRALNHFLEEVRVKAADRRPEFMRRLADLKKNFAEEDQSSPVFMRIEELINQDSFGAAESYIRQARQGVLEIRNEGLGDPNSELNRFLAACGQLCQTAGLGKRMADAFRAQHKYESNRNVTTGEFLLQSWPESSTKPETVAKFLQNLGLTAKVTGDKTPDHFRAAFEEPGRVENYPHPIADFGTKMYKQGLDVFLIFGNKNVDELFTAMNALLQRTTTKPVLLLVNSAILPQERRKLARKIAQNIRTNAPCLLLDRALVYYLAGCALSERWKILIQCALPFQPTQIQNPYFENSSAEIPPEMFIGRREELMAIIDPAGANLIYGGRQLGKTALLQRAKTLQHQPKEKSWSVYVDVKGMDATESAKAVCKALVQGSFLMHDAKVRSWKELVEAIELRLMARSLTDTRLLLLIDEADHLLKTLEAGGYKELDQLKRLQTTSEGRFKFVLAGLHNVVRFSRKALTHNSSLPQLQGITVKPLSFSDARELLEIPLSHLGFMIRPGEEDLIASILFNTNYFPGLVHFYASRLVKYMQKNASNATMPPYILDREVLTRVLADDDFIRMRIERLKMTLGIDADEHSYYDALAHLLCYCCLESEEVRSGGMTAAEIRKECKELSESCSLALLETESIEALLDELVELNIFIADPSSGQKRYLFSRPMFIEMLGTKDAVESHLLEVLEK